MSKILYTKEEVEYLKRNKHVDCCSSKSVTYSTAFKEKAVGLYENEGLTPREIFEDEGFDLSVLGSAKATECLRRWRKTVSKKGIGSLVDTRGTKGGRRKSKNLSNEDQIEYLETQIEYLKAENAFLARLRAKRAE